MEWGQWVAIIVAFLGGGGLVAWYKAKPENRVNDAEAWSKLVVNLQNEVTRLAERITKLETESLEKDARIKQLEEENEAKDRKIHELEEKIAELEKRRSGK